MKDPYMEEIFIPFVLEHKENLYRLAYSYVKNKEDALDIVQDSIHKGIVAIQHDKRPEFIKSWLYRIVVNTSIDFLRKYKRVDIMDCEKIEFHSAYHRDHYENIDLAKAMDQLPEKYRTVVILRFFEDLKIVEIAQVLDLNPNTIKTRLYKALKWLKINLKEEDYD
ncbi:sigma-70 family RNA polymerase sigma factor [Bacillus testis]|uniref:sigma-70 family RNA polymerase sigma factor n=1 Tax=Bacillus testis TaxID=1622072 RepID=UPI00067F46AD|nr:sigma-70 family RNA polymerase sigma factor [Bacillus testis]